MAGTAGQKYTPDNAYFAPEELAVVPFQISFAVIATAACRRIPSSYFRWFRTRVWGRL
jgi:hypothetical protein